MLSCSVAIQLFPWNRQQVFGSPDHHDVRFGISTVMSKHLASGITLWNSCFAAALKTPGSFGPPWMSRWVPVAISNRIMGSSRCAPPCVCLSSRPTHWTNGLRMGVQVHWYVGRRGGSVYFFFFLASCGWFLFCEPFTLSGTGTCVDLQLYSDKHVICLHFCMFTTPL